VDVRSSCNRVTERRPGSFTHDALRAVPWASMKIASFRGSMRRMPRGQSVLSASSPAPFVEGDLLTPVQQRRAWATPVPAPLPPQASRTSSK